MKKLMMSLKQRSSPLPLAGKKRSDGKPAAEFDDDDDGHSGGGGGGRYPGFGTIDPRVELGFLNIGMRLKKKDKVVLQGVTG